MAELEPLLIEYDENNLILQQLAYSEIPNRYVTEILEVGVNYDDTIFVFAFDNSLSHSAFAKDALVANRMNIKYDSKQL
ncbi:20837_t:CDS:2 [Cetraspora pellucida]|uniref:20837_t:CDS:1 n=1 Tax=Cetraspora pellucida TaxID=1433469 RepID=A0A9N9HKM1_9GLOM|nr:20837_t:CDS:2 [Cetraspora pellucida]